MRSALGLLVTVLLVACTGDDDSGGSPRSGGNHTAGRGGNAGSGAAGGAAGAGRGGTSGAGTGGRGGPSGRGGTGGVPPPPVPDVCTAPVAPVDTSKPTTVVNPCTEAALDAAITAGGIITFNCGQARIDLQAAKTIRKDTVIDGGGQVTLSGNNA